MKVEKLTNTELHAYVDNELDEDRRHLIIKAAKADPELNAQIDAIKSLKLDIASAFSPIQDNTALAESIALSESNESPQQKYRWVRSYWAAAACLVVGIMGGYLLGQHNSNPSSPSQNWIAQVINYQDMYSTDTLAHVVSTNAERAKTLARLSSALRHEVIIPEFSVQAIEFKRGQILTSQQQTVIQLAFLDTVSGVPIALCITPNTEAARDFSDGNMYGVNYVNWSSDKLDFLIVGNITHQQLNSLARDAKLQFSNS